VALSVECRALDFQRIRLTLYREANIAETAAMSTSNFLLYIAPLLLLGVGLVVYWVTGREDDDRHLHPGE
jgi:hypothetical protein